MNSGSDGKTKMPTDVITSMLKAITASAGVVIRQARFHNTKIVSWQDGKIVEIDPYSIEIESDKRK